MIILVWFLDAEEIETFKKRPLMAKIAKSYCKKIYVTDDNPRKENPRKIRNEIAKHLKGSSYFNIGNREKAN